MDPFLGFLVRNREGLYLFLWILLAVLFSLHWVLWLFNGGRFRPAPQGAGPQSQQPVRYVLANFFAEIVNDFRHLLALVVMLVFTLTLIAAVYPGIYNRDMAMITEGIESVAAALGGLIGSIIGYYFGESAATKRAAAQDQVPPATQPPIQRPEPPGMPSGDIRPAAAPPIPVERGPAAP